VTILYYTIKTLGDLLVLLVFIYVILSFIMDPYHPVRRRVDSIVEPMLTPIRRVVPLVGMLDFSPIILIILIRIVFSLILKLLR